MGYKIPWSNFHELNLDWLLQQVKKLREDVDGLIGGATPSDDTPEMDGAGAPGTSVSYARGDHQHPTDTSRAAASDLTQEITDRGNADLTLAREISDVDAKIKFSAAAPFMDSSSASAGISDYMARADHVHPTDTSRASALDVATLTARMDGFSGSANPSDATPQMDGVGSAGTGGNYSRGDHVHPSDTSKLDKTGGTITGDLQINGYLKVAQEAKYITGVNSVGWLRIATVPYAEATEAEFIILKQGLNSPPETHKIEFAILRTGYAFRDEVSIGDVRYIDKIRYTSAGAIDIHMDYSYECDIAVYLVRRGVTEAKAKAILLENIAPVADAPDGESIYREHSFYKNSDEDYTYTVGAGSNNIDAYSYLRRENDMVLGYLVVSANALTANSWHTLATIPTDIWPNANVNFVGLNNTTGLGIQSRISSGGNVQIYATSAISAGTYLYIPFQYVKKEA